MVLLLRGVNKVGGDAAGCCVGSKTRGRIFITVLVITTEL